MAEREYVLRADLSSETVGRERVPGPWRRRFLGGKGLGARYLYEELDADTDPLGPDNLLALCIGPLSGYLPGETRYAAVTKSPLTGGFLDSYAGGSFADRLVGSLDDCLALLVTGEADEPVRVVVENGEGRVERAYSWGEDTVATAEAHPDSGVACIGPAGERGVAYATVASDAGDHHAGRGGAGAVMGAKRLKAVVARNDAPETPPELAALRERDEREYAEGETGRWQAAGETLESVDFANEVGALATEGWQRDQFEAAEDIGVEAAAEAADGREHPDRAVPGGFEVETAEGRSVPRGATPMTLGAGLGVGEFDAVAELGGLCDRLGIDVISAGNAVAWAIRAAEAGRIDCDLSFGDADGARRLIEAIATGASGPCESGVAETLADGVVAATEAYDTDDVIPTVKSMELPAYDPRAAVGMALAYATSDRGGCHRRARPIEWEVFAEDAGESARIAAVVTAQNTRSALWSFVADDFAGEPLWGDFGAEWFDALGYGYETADLRLVGERVWNLVRLFNAREGFDRDADELPEAFTEPISDGPAAGGRIDPAQFDALLDAYYDARGWSREGLPTRETLARLDLAADAETPVGEAPDRTPKPNPDDND
ncbi:aldehyde ferredoxin oxidoreductase C-terminal domain-containing protein [Halorubrum sp. AD140]|uniref:aldehyde ferredoxin oxidoreductase family protein n=1 Tax=Halorubrum sp. AD140 TaxID=3050073 RepID=UPI002ACC837C|nr:aldehyde ferredoxin oxidoreductase C-terminal domain-containing protein [Halorubrum sp. AD140]MDZ5810617.1 aldehyde ferredoxin oxidoreductase C-terminal domain-containing protein [Halorubrum sp. AD140]